MNEHLNGWLEAYHDGQLEERRARKVEAHLSRCPSCRAELERLGALRLLLTESPEGEMRTPAEQFVAQVGLRLPRRPASPTWQRSLVSLWRAVPVALLGIWVFIQTLLASTALIGVALDLGFWSDLRAGLSLGWRSSFSSATLLSLASSALMGLLLLSWVASWWVRKQSGASATATE